MDSFIRGYLNDIFISCRKYGNNHDGRGTGIADNLNIVQVVPNKKLTCLFAGIIFSLISNAQIQFGPVAGYSLSDVITKEVPEVLNSIMPTGTSSASSFYIGVASDIGLSDHFSFSPEIFYTRRGRNLYFDQLQIDIQLINNDIIVPLFIKYNFLNRIRIYAGPELSYVVSLDTKSNLNVRFDSRPDVVFDIACSVGASVRVFKNMLLDLRYSRGLIDQKKGQYIPGEFFGPAYAGQQILDDYIIKNWCFQVGLQYLFILKSKAD